MGLFDSVRGYLGDEESADASDDLSADDVPRLDHRDPTPMDFRNKAVDAVQEWTDCDLDYSLDSLERLDAFARKQGARLAVFREESDDDGERVADMHTAFTIRAGSYFGEVLVRELGGDWTENDGTWVVMVPTGDDAQEVDVFEVASHSFAEQPLFVDLAAELGADVGEDDEEDDATDETVDLRPKFRPEAEEFAAFWDRYDLDFAALSLTRLDVLTESEWDDDEFDGVEAGGEDMDAKMYTELVKQLGSYYGEVLVRELDGQWTRRSGAVVVVVPGRDTDDATVPVFDVAEAGLTGDEEFAVDFSLVAERTGRDDQSVPTRGPDATDDDIDVAADTAERVSDGDQEDEADPAPPETNSDTETSETAAATDSGEAETTDSEGSAVTGPAEAAATESEETAGRTESVGGDAEANTESDETGQSNSKVASPADILGVDSSDVEDAADLSMDEDVETDHVAEADTPADDAGSEVAGNDGGETVGDDETEPTAADEAFVESMIGDGTDTADDDTDEIPRVDAETSERGADETDAPEQLDLGGGGGDSESGPTPDELREDAEAFAATWPGHELDFSPASLERLDTLVTEEYEAEDVPDVDLSGATETGYLAARVVEAGGYFAEVLRRRFGGQWRDDDGGLVFVVSGQTGEARLDPAAVATACFRGRDSFAARYGAVCDQLSVSE